MRKTTMWSMFVMALLLVSTVCRSDQRGGSGTLPDMLLGVLASAQVELEPSSLVHALATHPDPLIRGLAAEALGLLGERSAETSLLSSLQTDADRMVRELAALALARMGNETGLTALKGFLRSSDSPVRQLTMAAQLAELGESAGFSIVVEAAASRQTSTRSLAAEALAAFVSLAGLTDDRGRSPAEMLLELAGDDSAEVRLTVVQNLPEATRKGMDLEAARSTTKRLAADVDPVVRESAQSLLDAWRFDADEKARREGGPG
ncbi:MAG: HEAT repeat domain-containing protein [Acidobacteriota bacterium]